MIRGNGFTNLLKKMSKESHYDIATIKDRLHIWDVLASFGYQVANKCGVIKSPLRPEKSPSFSIYKGGKNAKDHSTGENWDVISLYADLDQCSTHEAIVGCGQLAGLQGEITPNDMHVPPPPRSSLPTKPSPKGEGSFTKNLPQLTEKLCAQMRIDAHASLQNTSSPLSVFANHKGLTKKTIITAINKGMIGVLNSDAIGKPVIVWLFKDWSGALGAKIRFDPLSSRKTIWWQGAAKEFLFGDIATSSREIENFERPPIFLTEGESDALTVMQFGYQAMGIVGANTIPTTPKLHAYLSHRPVGIVYDSDAAGISSSSKLADYIVSHLSGTTVYNLTNSGAMQIPAGSDINETMQDIGYETYKRVMKVANAILSSKGGDY